MSISIAIPVTDVLGQSNFNDLDNLLKDIEPDHKKYDCILLMMDSVEWSFLQYFKEKYPWAVIIENTGKALQFTKNANLGLRFIHKHTDSDGVFLVNQDCRIRPYDDMKWIANEGICSPKTVNQFPLDLCLPKMLRYEEVERFAFFCPYISRNSMNKIGYLDEAFIKLFSDDDYCLRCHLAGISVKASNIDIYHKGSFNDLKETGLSSSGCYNMVDLGTGLGQYKAKWKIPNNISHENAIKWILDNYVWEDKFICH